MPKPSQPMNGTIDPLASMIQSCHGRVLPLTLALLLRSCPCCRSDFAAWNPQRIGDNMTCEGTAAEGEDGESLQEDIIDLTTPSSVSSDSSDSSVLTSPISSSPISLSKASSGGTFVVGYARIGKELHAIRPTPLVVTMTPNAGPHGRSSQSIRLWKCCAYTFGILTLALFVLMLLSAIGTLS